MITETQRAKTEAEQERAERRGRHDAEAAKGPTDARIAGELDALLRHHPSLDASGVEISVDQGRVVLLGFVPNEQSRQLCETIARSINGVSDIRDDLTVGQAF